MGLGAVGDARVDDWYAVGLWLHLAMSRQARENGYSGPLVQTPVKKSPGQKRPPLSSSCDTPKARGRI